MICSKINMIVEMCVKCRPDTHALPKWYQAVKEFERGVPMFAVDLSAGAYDPFDVEFRQFTGINENTI